MPIPQQMASGENHAPSSLTPLNVGYKTNADDICAIALKSLYIRISRQIWLRILYEPTYIYDLVNHWVQQHFSTNERPSSDL